jgi:hypothetical protein
MAATDDASVGDVDDVDDVDGVDDVGGESAPA